MMKSSKPAIALLMLAAAVESSGTFMRCVCGHSFTMSNDVILSALRGKEHRIPCTAQNCDNFIEGKVLLICPETLLPGWKEFEIRTVNDLAEVQYLCSETMELHDVYYQKTQDDGRISTRSDRPTKGCGDKWL